MRAMSHDQYMAGSEVRSFEVHGFRADGNARDPGLRRLPCGWEIQGYAGDLRWMPFIRLSEGVQSESHRAGNSANLSGMSLNFRMAAGQLQSQRGRIPIDRWPRKLAVQSVPHQRQLQSYFDGMCFLPLEGLSGNDESESCDRGNTTDMRSVSYHVGVDAGNVRSLEDGIPSYRCARERSMHPVSLEWQLQPDYHGLRVMPHKRLSGDN
jgi:hypothetical protein